MYFCDTVIFFCNLDRDRRKNLSLEEARPFVSFCLFFACPTSPALSILKDPNTVDEELRKLARAYLMRLVKVDTANSIIELPALMKLYWKDFGGGQRRALKFVAKLLPKGCQLSEDMKSIQAHDNLTLDFAELDWTPLFILDDNK